ncbi:hypothetical protein VNO80_30183 [Phaseolus coccineus]|uniref:Uncharacterized protein n=1 Tax=Phaseolus coccineus TaxID=3886 RepID=A0AAN9LHD8_PHACN
MFKRVPKLDSTAPKSCEVIFGSIQRSTAVFGKASYNDYKTIPSGIQHLEKLQVVDILYMSKEFQQRIDPNGGEEHWMIKHVPHVHFVTANRAWLMLQKAAEILSLLLERYLSLRETGVMSVPKSIGGYKEQKCALSEDFKKLRNLREVLQIEWKDI